MKLVDNEQCTGCGACVKKCPKEAILFNDDSEGFPTPVIDNSKCINCGLCNRVCPAIHMPETHGIQESYAAQIIDETILMDSTSGGVFTALSRVVFRQSGVVYGCIWDKNYNAVICRAETEEGIQPMRGSKYVWSYAAAVFPEIEEMLNEGRTVMFSGLPCQVAGLKNYLMRDYETLFTIDFLCSGSPSPMAFQKYLDTICHTSDKDKLNLKFRDKNPYGVGVHITYTGKRKASRLSEHISNSYYYSFFSHLIDRRSCYKCPYGTDLRISDITIGDYWGVSNYHQGMDVRAGISALMVNSDKGKVYLNSIKDTVQLSKTKKENIAKANNLGLDGQKRNREIPAIRDDFFKILQTNGWKKADRKYLCNAKRYKLWIKSKLSPQILGKVKKIKRMVRRY